MTAICQANSRKKSWFELSKNLWMRMAVLVILVCSSSLAKSQNEQSFDELSVYFQVQNIGTKEISAIVRDQEVLLPVADVFDFLKIKANMAQSMDSVSGFFISPESTYLVDRTHTKIVYLGKTYQLKPTDIIRTETNLYLLSKYFGEIFGLNCTFSMRTLAVTMFTKIELPALRDMRLEQMRDNVSHLKGESKSDTTIKQSHPFLHFGMADWSIIASQPIGSKSDTRINLALGSMFAGGEANFMLNYNNNEPFSEKQQFYYLRYVNNDNNFLRQTTFGKIASNATSSIYNPIVGVTLTNSPTTFRRSFGTYPLSDYTSPGWMVELYVNNVLADYKKADASGFFTFQVPLVYGASNIKLKFYGPWGEEHSKEQLINIPFNFLPVNDIEYTLSAGMIEDGKQSMFSRGILNYGLTRSITLGAGVEYNSTIPTGNLLPFVTLATRPFSNLILSGEYTHGVRGKGGINYQLPKNIQFELNYTKYVPGQKAVNFSFLEERKAIISLPVKSNNYSFYNRMTYTQTILPQTQYSNMEWLLSGAVLGVNTNLTNYAMFVKGNQPFIFSNLSFSLRLPKGFMLIPQAQYEFSHNELISFKAGIEKYLFKNGFFTLSYEDNLKSKFQSTQFSFRYDLPFAQAGLTARKTNNTYTMMEIGRGSLIMDASTKYFGINNRVNVGKGGIVFSPFLDMNCNHKRDPGEPKILGLSVRMNGGIAIDNPKDSTIRIMDLEPYVNYLVELDPNSFDNVSWKITKKTLNVTVDPNDFKLIEIPISVVGEISGTINRIKGKNQEGLGRIVVNIFDSNSRLVGRTLSEQDGYYNYLGLAPGDFEAKIDSIQLSRLHLSASPVKYSFSIKKIREGDILEGKDFLLKSTLPNVVDTTHLEINKPVDTKASGTKTEENKPAIKSPDETNPGEEKIKEPTSGNLGTGKLETNDSNSKGTKQTGPKVPTNAPDTNKTTNLNTSNNAPGAAKPTDAKPPVSQLPANVPADQPAQSLSKKVSVSSNATNPSATSISDQIFLQVGAFKDLRNAEKMARSLKALVNFPVDVVQENGWFKTRFGPFTTGKEAADCKTVIVEKEILAANLIRETHQNKTEKTQPPQTLATTVPIAKQIVAPKPSAKQPPVPKISSKPEINQKESVQDLANKTGFGIHKHYFVQISAFMNARNATGYVKNIYKLVPYTLGIFYRDQFYKVRYGPFDSQEEVNDCILRVVKAGLMTKELIKVDFEETGFTPVANLPFILNGFDV